ncbi:uncharacterized protein LOC121757619 [Salvia splendens]|uniref:uncharacterized protein LOC121757619 n=1 Tax=Salvia splendens TaxID=180675 RepID=UPI001C262169|nr:uncharacterized protein LOC121757619 [Salvia splendens]
MPEEMKKEFFEFLAQRSSFTKSKSEESVSSDPIRGQDPNDFQDPLKREGTPVFEFSDHCSLPHSSVHYLCLQPNNQKLDALKESNLASPSTSAVRSAVSSRCTRRCRCCAVHPPLRRVPHRSAPAVIRAAAAAAQSPPPSDASPGFASSVRCLHRLEELLLPSLPGGAAAAAGMCWLRSAPDSAPVSSPKLTEEEKFHHGAGNICVKSLIKIRIKDILF